MLSLIIVSSMFTVASCSSTNDSDTENSATATATDNSYSSDDTSSDSAAYEDTTDWYAYLYDADGNVITSASIEIIDGTNTYLTTTTDENGYFRLSAMPVNVSVIMIVSDSSGEEIAHSTIKVRTDEEFSADDNTYGYLDMYIIEDTDTLYMKFNITDEKYIGCSSISDTEFENSTTED